MLRRQRRWPGGFLAAGSAVLALAACSLVAPQFIKPDVSVAGIEFVGGNFFQQNFHVKLNIQNPNARAIPVTGLHVELNVAGDRLASGVSDKPFVVPAHGATQFDMNVTANAALALLKFSQRKGSAPTSIDYDLTGAASIDLPFLRDLPFHQTGSFPLGSQ